MSVAANLKTHQSWIESSQRGAARLLAVPGGAGSALALEGTSETRAPALVGTRARDRKGSYGLERSAGGPVIGRRGVGESNTLSASMGLCGGLGSVKETRCGRGLRVFTTIPERPAPG